MKDRFVEGRWACTEIGWLLDGNSFFLKNNNDFNLYYCIFVGDLK